MKLTKAFSILIIAIMVHSCSKVEESVVLKYLGVYDVEDNCDNVSTQFTMEIIPTSTTSVNNIVLIENFGGYGSTLEAEVDFDNLYIDYTVDNLLIEGTGVISNDRQSIIFEYSASNDNNISFCSCVANKN